MINMMTSQHLVIVTDKFHEIVLCSILDFIRVDLEKKQGALKWISFFASQLNKIMFSVSFQFFLANYCNNE